MHQAGWTAGWTWCPEIVLFLKSCHILKYGVSLGKWRLKVVPKRSMLTVLHWMIPLVETHCWVAGSPSRNALFYFFWSGDVITADVADDQGEKTDLFYWMHLNQRACGLACRVCLRAQMNHYSIYYFSNAFCLNCDNEGSLMI